MSILSDKQIKALSMLPLARVSYCRLKPEHGAFDPTKLYAEQSTLPREVKAIHGDPFTDLQVEVTKIVASDNRILPWTVQSNLTTDEEIANFKPMIEPFLPMQVRTAGHDRRLRALLKPTAMSPEASSQLISVFDGDPEFSGDLESLDRRIISKGLTSFGYDVTLADDAAIFTNINSTIIDPLNFAEETLQRVIAKDGYFIMPPNSYMLGYTKEYFRIPRNIIAIALGKSTYARAGAIINVTPIEPGFEGTVVIEIANATSLPMKVYANQGIAQFLFFEANGECEVSYADRNNGEGGKYQGQVGLVLAKG